MNKKYFLLTCLAAFPFALTAQENNRYEEITNPKLTSINREPARSTFTSYVTEADAVINDRKNGTFRLSLNGEMEIPLRGSLRRPPHGLHDGPCGTPAVGRTSMYPETGSCRDSARPSM